MELSNMHSSLNRFPQRLRLVVSLMLMLLLFALTTIFTQVNTDYWQTGFFVFTIVIIVFISSESESDLHLFVLQYPTTLEP